MVILAHCCTRDEEESVLKGQGTDGLLATNPHHPTHQAGGDAIPEHDSHWDQRTV